MKNKITKSTIITLILMILFLSCEEQNNCRPEFLAQLSTIKQQYKTLYTEDSDNLDKQELITSLTGFLVKFNSQSCLEGKLTHSPSEDITHLLNDLKGEQRVPFESNVFLAKVIYGADDRVEVSQSSNEMFKILAKSTAAMIKNTKISEDLKLSDSTLGESFNLCHGERFREQINPASCSGFLVAANIMVTAGHCIKNQFDCDSSKWVFDFNSNEKQLQASQIFSCKNLIERRLVADGPDFALFTIERSVLDRKPLKFRTSGVIDKGQSIVVIGHPSGLPTKIAAGASVREQSHDDFFVANLDTFGGNSGSAVFNEKTGLVEGILVRGETDYKSIMVNGKSCRKVFQCDSDKCRGEDVTKITAVEGLPKPARPLKDITLKGIETGTLKKIFMGGSLTYFGLEYDGFLLAGRQFLDLCGLQVSTSQESSNWLAKTLTNCHNDQEINQVFLKFEEFIN
jgi:V8-like Glu-specific endopeptidase